MDKKFLHIATFNSSFTILYILFAHWKGPAFLVPDIYVCTPATDVIRFFNS